MRITTTLLTLALLVLGIAGTALGKEVFCAPKGTDFPCLGTPAADQISGTNSVDRIRALAGGDTLEGRGAADHLSAGPGNDHIFAGGAGKGQNTVRAGKGNDVINVVNGSRDDVVCGLGERDEVRADPRGVDAISGNCEKVSYAKPK
jgi:Ca2+-binding RTX toxin-like protein